MTFGEAVMCAIVAGAMFVTVMRVFCYVSLPTDIRKFFCNDKDTGDAV